MNSSSYRFSPQSDVCGNKEATEGALQEESVIVIAVQLNSVCTASDTA